MMREETVRVSLRLSPAEHVKVMKGWKKACGQKKPAKYSLNSYIRDRVLARPK